MFIPGRRVSKNRIHLGDRLPNFEYHAPATLADAVRLLAKLKGSMVVQGGTDLVVAAKLKGLQPAHVVSLRKLSRLLKGIGEKDGSLFIGASTTFEGIAESELVEREIPALQEAAKLVGSRQIRNVATIGGNLCNASPAADSVPPLLVLEAQLEVQGVKGERKIPLDKFFVGPGKTVLARGDVLKRVRIPKMKKNTGAAFEKLGRRAEEDISVVSAASFVRMEKNVIKEARIALGSVAPTPIRAKATERLVVGKSFSEDLLREAGEEARRECNPITDIRAEAGYRKAMVGVLVRETLKKAVIRASAGGD